MSAHDLNISNQGFAAFRSDLNSALGALGSQSASSVASSGLQTGMLQLWTSTPSTDIQSYQAYDGADWSKLAHFDVTNNVVIPWGAIAARVVAKSTNFTAGSTNMGQLLVCSPSTGGMSVTISTATQVNGFTVSFENAADDIVTIGATTTIGGITGLSLARGQTASIHYDGTNFRVTGLGGRRFLGRTVASSAASVDVSLNTIHDDYIAEFTNLWPSTPGSGFLAQYSVSGTFSTQNYSHVSAQALADDTVTALGSSGNTSGITYCNSPAGSTSAPYGGSGWLKISGTNSTQYKISNFQFTANSTQGNLLRTNIGGGTHSTIVSAVDGLRFAATSGNINGTFDLWAILK